VGATVGRFKGTLIGAQAESRRAAKRINCKREGLFMAFLLELSGFSRF
jgi:hypothetical protein